MVRHEEEDRQSKVRGNIQGEREKTNKPDD